MKWTTRSGCHVDRAACAWPIRRFLDTDADYVFVDDPDDVPPDATAFDMPGVELSHHDGDCTFETMLRRNDLDDDRVLAVTGPLFDGLYEYRRRALMLGHDPA